MKDIVNRDLVNLTNCDQEPIHIPGSIQPHGMLIALPDLSADIQFCSANSTQFIGLEPEQLLGRKLSEVFSSTFVQSLQSSQFQDGKLHRLPTVETGLIATIHRSADQYILEFEAESEGEVTPDLIDISRELIDYLEQTSTLVELADKIAEGTRKITGYDRVMIYRFDKHYNGEVIAESKREELESFLGLHYPHTDIPTQARTLYIRNQLRLLADIDYSPVPILTLSDVGHDALDLSLSYLRSVSPIHVQYLHNMGVGATLTISLLHHGKLWGLIACHHYAPKQLNYQQRMSAKLLGHFITSQIDTRQLNEEFEVAKLANEAVGRLLKTDYIADRNSLQELLEADDMLRVTNAAGVALVLHGQVLTRGLTPSDQSILTFSRTCAQKSDFGKYATASVSEDFPELAADLTHTPGIIYLQLDSPGTNALLWFRPEVSTEVNWAGDPSKAIEKNSNGLSPRKSFEAWKQTVTGTSQEWYKSEISAAEVVANTLSRQIATILLSEEELKQRVLAEELRETNAELENINWISTHDLNEPLRKIQMMASYLLQEETDLSETVRLRISKMNQFAEKMQTLIGDIVSFSKLGRTDDRFETVDMNALISGLVLEMRDILTDANAEITTTELSSVRGIPFLLKQLFLNLFYNALKFSGNTEHPVIKVTSEIVSELPDKPAAVKGFQLIRIADNGIGFDEEHKEQIFKIFSRLQTVQKTQGSGIGLALCRKIMQMHGGYIMADSRPGEGAEFMLYFPI